MKKRRRRRRGDGDDHDEGRLKIDRTKGFGGRDRSLSPWKELPRQRHACKERSRTITFCVGGVMIETVTRSTLPPRLCSGRVGRKRCAESDSIDNRGRRVLTTVMCAQVLRSIKLRRRPAWQRRLAAPPARSEAATPWAVPRVPSRPPGSPSRTPRRP